MSHSGRQLLGSDKVTLWINEEISYKLDNTKRLVNQMKTGSDKHKDIPGCPVVHVPEVICLSEGISNGHIILDPISGHNSTTPLFLEFDLKPARFFENVTSLILMKLYTSIGEIV